MREFEIRLTSVADVQAFVATATTRAFPIFVKDTHQRQVNGKSFMEMFCLDFTRPITVMLECTEEELEAFQTAIRRFVVE